MPQFLGVANDWKTALLQMATVSDTDFEIIYTSLNILSIIDISLNNLHL